LLHHHVDDVIFDFLGQRAWRFPAILLMPRIRTKILLVYPLLVSFSHGLMQSSAQFPQPSLGPFTGSDSFDLFVVVKCFPFFNEARKIEHTTHYLPGRSVPRFS
jgi:hypothetical protein